MIKNSFHSQDNKEIIPYQLYCPACDCSLEDHYTIKCPIHLHLVQSKYFTPHFLNRKWSGIWKYTHWLPIKKPGFGDSGPVTYQSEQLARELNLKRLYVSFNGYWPEQQAFVKSCTFKEYEALVTFQRLEDHNLKGIYLASAGNTARAFAQVAQGVNKRSILFVPETSLSNLWTIDQNNSNIVLVTLNSQSDYTDAIQLASHFSDIEGYVPEGGARNVARRDGMSTVMYDHVARFDRLPDHYFQGIGSGTGAIAAWEGAKRFITLGNYGNTLPQLHLGQNHPYDPIVHAWQQKIRNFDLEMLVENPREKIHSISATMLSNRTPPYSIPGGLFDALVETQGEMYSASNNEVNTAVKLFMETEEIDIVPEAGVALASLIQAIETHKIHNEDTILLNITGGGFTRLQEDYSIHPISPTFHYKNLEDIKEIKNLF